MKSLLVPTILAMLLAGPAFAVDTEPLSEPGPNAETRDINQSPGHATIDIDHLATRHTPDGKVIEIYMVTITGEAPRLACEDAAGHEVYCSTGEEPQ